MNSKNTTNTQDKKKSVCTSSPRDNMNTLSSLWIIKIEIFLLLLLCCLSLFPLLATDWVSSLISVSYC